MHTDAIIFREPEHFTVDRVELTVPGPEDVVVEMLWSGVSTGTEKLLWNGEMPWFPGLAYPLVPGYEGVGTAIESDTKSRIRAGTRVFVPGANCFTGARGLFGAQARRVVVPQDRLLPVDETLGSRAVLLSLAATAQHAIAGSETTGSTLVIGHGALGRLIARLIRARGDPPPTVWEKNAARRNGADGYDVVAPDADVTTGYATVFDASGDSQIIDQITPHLARSGEIVLAGFYAKPVSFNFPPAFMREARFRVAAEWRPNDLADVMRLIDESRLSLDGLISHRVGVAEAEDGYATAFNDPECIKMIIDWRS